MTKIVLAAAGRDDQLLIVPALEKAGHTVVVVDDAAQLDASVEGAAVLMADVELPPAGLAALLATWEESGRANRPTVLALCSADTVPLAREAVERGARDYCLRPVQLDRLITKIDLAAHSVQHETSPPPPGEERRRWPRRQQGSPVQIVIDGITIDISEGGMQIAAPCELADDLVVLVVSEFIGQLTGRPAADVRCRVVHHHRLNGKFAYGVSFVEMDDSIRESIRQWAAT